MLAESLAQLLDWCRRSSYIPRVVHTASGQAVWVRVDAGRLAHLPLRDPMAAAAIPVATPEAVDALAALDTGDAVLQAAIARARKAMGKPIAPAAAGRSGVGKELFARAMHDSGPRRAQSFVAVNCTALPENLIEAALFGYQGGAFTGARREGAPGRIREAHGGTLFLDEIGDMPLSLQARLLRVLQDREVVPLGGGKPVAVDFALVCATHRHLPAEMQAGRFREDLYYRLNGLTLQLPALRERSDLDHLLARELQGLVPDRAVSIAPDLLQVLRRYRWPGNMRQLAIAPDHRPHRERLRGQPVRSRPQPGYQPQHALPQAARLSRVSGAGNLPGAWAFYRRPSSKYSMSAFCACMRFSASSHTTDCGPSMTSASTSSPRCAGRQCMKRASGLAARIISLSTHQSAKAFLRASFSAS